MKITILTFILLFTFSCSKDFVDAYHAYEIKQGEHYSDKGFGVLFRIKDEGRHLKFEAYFGNGCLYDTVGMGIDAYDINKLYGFTDAWSNVERNSIRIGWRHVSDGRIEVFAYWTIDGKDDWFKLGETVQYKVDLYELWARNDKYEFTFNDVHYIAPRTHPREHGLRFIAFPYFGGNLPARNNMWIHIYEYN